MAYTGFLVWGHHTYLVGLDRRSRTLYSTITIIISLPSTIKMVNWTLSLLNGALKVDSVLLWSIAYILVFTVGGFTCMWLSHVGLNVAMHDTFYVIAHFHLMLSRSTITGIFFRYVLLFLSYFWYKILQGVRLHAFYLLRGWSMINIPTYVLTWVFRVTYKNT
jgi:heme/copper-type cytochrome/quinol oxidase subunit 1